MQQSRNVERRSLMMMVSLMLAVIMTFAMTAVPSYADAADTVNVSLTDKAGNEAVLATWTFDSENTTYKDGENELSIVKDFTNADNLKGEINGNEYDFTTLGALVYTGLNKKPDPRCLSVTTKGILLEDLYDYAENLAGMDLRGDTMMYLSDATGFNDTFTYDQYWGLDKYYYPDWYFAETYSAEDMGTTAMYVPATLAVCGFHGTTGQTVEGLISKADSANSLRISTGVQKDGNRTIEAIEGTTYFMGDINEGMLSVKNINTIKFMPVYHSINVPSGTASGTAGTDLAYKVENATITTSDNYFKAANGETVLLNVKPDAGCEVKKVSVESEEEDIDVERTEGNVYAFEMPEGDVTVSVETEALLDGLAFDEETGSYLIGSKSDMELFAKIVNSGDSFKAKAAKLSDDIDLSGETWTPIGAKDTPFEGTFDGAGHKIKGLTITDVKADYQGLFGNSNGTIRNFSIEGTISSESGDFYGGVAGFNSGTIENVISNVNITGKAYNVGGIAGLSTSGIWVIAGSNRVNEQFVIEGATGKISNCGWEGTELSATNKVGGIVGENAGYVSKCYSGAGKISAPGSGKGGAGGIVGRNGCNNEAYETGFVDSCYSFATVGSAGDRWFGGIVGFQNNKYGYSAKTEVSSTTNCYFAGTIVTGGYSSNWGPIVGAYDSAAQGYDNNYSLDTVISGDNKEITTGIRKTEAEMASPAFAELLGENFKASCGYPVLAWQDAKEHTPADAVEETVEPTYSKIGSIDTVVYCSECGAELSREAVKTDDSLKDQADAAIEAAEEALAAAEASSGEEAAELAETAAELAAEAKEAAKAALDAAQAEGNEEAIAEAKEAYDKADEVNDAAVIEQAEAIYAAESAIDNKNAAASALASIESAVEIDKYNGETAGSYKAAVTALKTLINDKKATASQLKKALLQVSQAYVNLTEKSVNTVTAAAKAKTVKAKKLKKKAMTVSGAVTVKDPVGTVTYAKAAGSAKQLSVNAKTGKITVKKKTKKGTYKIKVKVGASGNEDFFAGSQTVTVKIKVK